MADLRDTIATALTEDYGSKAHAREAADKVLAALGLPAIILPGVTYSTGHGWLAVPGDIHLQLTAAEPLVDAVRRWAEGDNPLFHASPELIEGLHTALAGYDAEVGATPQGASDGA